MRKAKGYLSNDNMFFDTEHEAKRHDAELEIVVWCESHRIKSDSVFRVIHALAGTLRSYIDADEKCKDPQCDSFHPLNRPEPKEDTSDDGEGEDDAAAV